MSWLYSRALVEEYSAANCSDGELSAQLSSSPTRQAFLPNGKTTGFSKLSRFGMTCAPLTASRGGDLLTWYLADSRARTSALRDRAQDSMESALDYGARWRASWAKYDHALCSWKTAQHSLLGGLESFSETWPRWGSMRNGECYQQPMLAHGISESESGSWLPTIGKNEFKGAGRARYRGSDEFRGAKMSEGLRTCREDPIYLTPSFAEYAMGWPLTWTELAPLETAKFQQWLQQHGAS